MSQTSKFTFNLGLNLSTALRATESFHTADNQIYDASFDYSMLSKSWRVLLLPGIRQLILRLIEMSGMGTPGMLLCRTRYIDDALSEWLGTEKQQVVCLGAGNDTRAYRIRGIKRTQYFEVDLPVPQVLKKKQMEKFLGELPGNVSYVAVDFENQDLGEELINAGYRPGLPTFFIWEGVTQYISQDAAEDVIRFACRAQAGSQIAFTFIKSGIIDGSRRSVIDQRIMNRVGRRGMPWIFGLDPDLLEVWLAEQGFMLIDQSGAMEYRQRYLSPVGRDMHIYSGERIALAEVTRQN